MADLKFGRLIMTSSKENGHMISFHSLSPLPLLKLPSKYLSTCGLDGSCISPRLGCEALTVGKIPDKLCCRVLNQVCRCRKLGLIISIRDEAAFEPLREN